jgi:hypothetical protein
MTWSRYYPFQVVIKEGADYADAAVRAEISRVARAVQVL